MDVYFISGNNILMYESSSILLNTLSTKTLHIETNLLCDASTSGLF